MVRAERRGLTPLSQLDLKSKHEIPPVPGTAIDRAFPGLNLRKQILEQTVGAIECRIRENEIDRALEILRRMKS
jgi:hypothetical protein